MAAIITLANMADKAPKSKGITPEQEQFLRNNYNIMTLEDLKAHTGLLVWKIDKMLKEYGLTKTNRLITKTKNQPVSLDHFNVDEHECWV